MPSASIRSKVNGINPIVGASRDDLVAADVVTVESVNVHTTYSWTLAYKPPGSTAVFSGVVTNSSPGTFTVDQEGPYLVRLIADLGMGSETTQYVRLRYLTVFGALKLVAAGEGYGGAIPVPVDQTPTGWTDALNTNLLILLGNVASFATSGRVFTVDPTAGFGDYNTLQAAIDAAVTAGASVTQPYAVLVRPGLYTENVTFKPFVHVLGWPGNPSGADNQRVVVVQGAHTAALPLLADTAVLSGLLLENIVSNANPTLDKTGAGALTLYRCNAEQNGLGALQGPAIRVTAGTVTVDGSEVVASASLVDTRSAITQPGASASVLTVRRSLVRGPTGLTLNESFGASCVTQVQDSRVVSTGAAGLGILSDATSLTLEYTRVDPTSGNPLAIHPGAGAFASGQSVTIRYTYLGGGISFDTTGIVGATVLQVGSSEYTAFTFPGGTPGTLAATTKATSLFFDNTVTGMAAENVQDAIDEVQALAVLVRTLDDAYDGGVPNSGSGRTIIADQGAVQILDAAIPSDPPPAGNTDGRLEILSGIRVGALGFPEVDIDPNPYGSGAMIRMGSRVVPNNIPFGAGTAFLMARSTGTPLFRDYNLRVQTESSTGGGAIGRLILQGGEGLDNGVSTPDAASVYIQAGSAFDITASPGSIFLAPGRQETGTSGFITLVRPDGSTPATLTAAGACADPIGVTGTITFATNMGAVTASLLAADTRAAVVAKLDALEGISAAEALGVITLTTDNEGPNAEVYFLSATAGVDAAIGVFDGQAQVDGSYGEFIQVQVTADQEISIGLGGAMGPLIYNADTGKLTVPGLIDPTGLIFEEAGAPTTGATEGALFVSDGSGGLTLHHLYFRGFSNSVPIDLVATTPALAAVLAVGNVTGGTSIVFTSGDEIQGQSAAGVAGMVVLRGGTDTGAGPTDGGNIRLIPGTGVGGGVDGFTQFSDATATQFVRFAVTASERLEIGTTLPFVFDGTTGKLTVPGLIDPTGIVFEEAGAPATGATEGAIFVSDGSGSLQTGSLYFGGPSNATAVDITTYSPYTAGYGGYSTAPASVQDASADNTHVGPVIYGAAAGKAGGPYWSRAADGTHPCRGQIRRGMLDPTDYCGPGWWTSGDGKVFLAYIPGVGYQVAFAATTNDLGVLTGSPVHVPLWPHEEANANANIVTFRVSTDGYRWTTLFTIDVSLAPYSTTTSSFSGFFVQGTAEILIERSDVQ